jgi:beta-glucuronidase
LYRALRTLPIVAALALGLPTHALAAGTEASKPTPKVLYQDGYTGRYLLDGVWYFRADPQDQGLGLGFQRQSDLTGWTPVNVPNAWNANDLSDASQRGGVGWYRKDFRVPAASRSTTWVARFESVNYRARVYLNGKQIGTHEGAYLPFEVPLTGVRKKGVNHLVVRVDSRRSDDDLPRWWTPTTAPPVAAGGTTAACCARSTCARSTSWTSRRSRLARSCPAATATRRC